MRPQVFTKLEKLVQQKKLMAYQDCWIYGILKQEFELNPDELNALAKVLGFKFGWNSTVEKRKRVLLC